MNPESIQNPTWSDVRFEFEPDGSWRDVYVFETTRGEWQALLDWVLTIDPSPRFTVDSEPAPLPPSVDWMFEHREEIAPSLHFVHRGVDYGLHFFQDDEIELDIDPREIRERNWSDFIATLSDVSRLLKRDVLVTPENLPQVAILRVNSDGVTYYPPDRD
jgi:hypothetical protein